MYNKGDIICFFLKENIDIYNPRYKLTFEEAKRLTKLEAIVEKLKRRENVQKYRLQTLI